MGRGVGPVGQWLASLDARGASMRAPSCYGQLGSPEGPFELKARAFAAAVTPA